MASGSKFKTWGGGNKHISLHTQYCCYFIVVTLQVHGNFSAHF